MSLMLAHQRKMKEQGQVETDESAVASSAKIGIFPGGSVGTQQMAELLTNSLEEDLHQLHEIQAVTRKIEFKKNELIPKYQPYISRLKELNQDHPLLGYYLVWLIDAQDWDEVLSFGSYCVENNISLPERFKSELKTFLVGEFCKWAEAELSADRSADPYIAQIFEMVIEQDWDIADAVTADLYKMMGFQQEQNGELEEAAELLTTALDIGAQVKTRLEKLKKKLKNSNESTEPKE
ncbi:phage terminase small subunit [Maridesulfovibrio ferrireducens]|uniref:phage terminase small subunit n=1 Tax=Maridesulfovibrio ferrireducens TaxID=246191 RepID=UPI001A27C0BC|nr:phage terminase small subunit [Maridesulfovibrio ferrireducens]MBI9109900.1 hypothetical protein [Maridesulfovibrio ferrireducens]